jgi:hypothetical protein
VDYYEGVVMTYLRADRSLFINTECCIQLNPTNNPDQAGAHWYCDAIVVDFRDKVVFLCEISFANSLDKLVKRLKQWNEN